MYLQKVRKSTLSIFDDKRCYIKETESKHGIENHNFIEKDFLFQ